MAGDIVVALGRVTVDGHTLFAQNSDGTPNDAPLLRLLPSQEHALGEKVRLRHLELAQARQTFAVLGSQPAGAWGFAHGVNEHGLAAGCCRLQTRFAAATPGLAGGELVRLALERTRLALRAVDLITDLVERHGQAEADCDASLLIADATEAFLIETAGNHWVLQDVGQVRAVSDVSSIHQDWMRISRGLAGHAIEQGWWPADGSKLGFADALGTDPMGRDSALRRWGRATYLLEQQSGHIDVPFLRRLLSDHYEGMKDEVDPLRTPAGPVPLCQHRPDRLTLAALVAPLRTDAPLAWCAFGPPCVGVWLPVFLGGDLPEALGDGSMAQRVLRLHEQLCRDPERAAEVCEAFDRLQARLDQDAEEFAAEVRTVEDAAERRRRASLFMQHCLERYTETLNDLLRRVYQLV